MPPLAEAQASALIEAAAALQERRQLRRQEARQGRPPGRLAQGQHRQERHDADRHDAAEADPGLDLVGVLLVADQQLVLAAAHRLDDPADLVHLRLALAGPHQGEGAGAVARAVEGDRAVELGELAVDGGAQGGEAGLLLAVAAQLRREARHLGGHPAEALGVGDQEGGVSGQKVAALPGLAVEEVGQHLHQGAVDRQGVGDAVLHAALPGEQEARSPSRRAAAAPRPRRSSRPGGRSAPDACGPARREGGRLASSAGLVRDRARDGPSAHRAIWGGRCRPQSTGRPTLAPAATERLQDRARRRTGHRRPAPAAGVVLLRRLARAAGRRQRRRRVGQGRHDGTGHALGREAEAHRAVELAREGCARSGASRSRCGSGARPAVLRSRASTGRAAPRRRSTTGRPGPSAPRAPRT